MLANLPHGGVCRERELPTREEGGGRETDLEERVVELDDLGRKHLGLRQPGER